jgi:hypothetical protein
MRKLVETVKGTGTLTMDGSRTLQVDYVFRAHRKYIDTDGYGGDRYSPAGYEIEGTISPGHFQGYAIRCGQETNVLDLGNGRQIDLNPPEQIQHKSFKVSAYHDYMTFFDTPLCRRVERYQEILRIRQS